MVSLLESLDRRPRFMDDAYSFMTQDRTRRTCSNISFADVKIGSTDSGLRESDDGVGWLGNSGSRALFQLDFSYCFVHECLHGRVGSLADWRSKDVPVGEYSYCSESLHGEETA